jgi:hypothetical protein
MSVRSTIIHGCLPGRQAGIVPTPAANGAERRRRRRDDRVEGE